MEGVGLYQRAGENLAHVVVAALQRGLMEIHLQWGVEQHRIAIHLIDILLQPTDFMGPVFGDDEQRLRSHLLHVVDPLFIEPGRDMLHGIEAEAVALGLLHHPARPVFDLLRHRPVAVIDIGAHQIVKVTQLFVNLIGPAVAGVIVNNFEYAIFIGIFDMVDAAKALVVPDKLRIFSLTGGEGVARPGLARDLFVIDLVAIVCVYPINTDCLFFIGTHLMVHHDVEQDGDAVLFQRADSRQQLGFIAVFGGNGTFLIKLAQVEEIVGVIPDRVSSRRRFISGGQPDHVNANIIKTSRTLSHFRPEFTAIRIVPVKALQ